MQNKIKLIRNKVGKGKIISRHGEDERIIEWYDRAKVHHSGIRVKGRSHK